MADDRQAVTADGNRGVIAHANDGVDSGGCGRRAQHGPAVRHPEVGVRVVPLADDGEPSLPTVIDVWRPTLPTLSTLVDVAAVHGTLLQCVMRRSWFVLSK